MEIDTITPRFLLAPALALILAANLGIPRIASAGSHHQNRPLVVVLDPGHGGVMHYGDESGAVDATGTLLEKTMTLEVATAAAKDLRAMGYRVYLTRTRDQAVNTPARDWNNDGKVNHIDEMDARTVFANRHHADVFVSIHFDGSSDPSIHGTHSYYCPARPFWRKSELLTTDITTSIVSALRRAGYPDTNNGVQTDVADVVAQTWADYPWFLVLGPSRYHRVVGTNMPGALVETLYMSSPRDALAMRKPAIVAAMARGYAAGIQAYLKATTK
ncbi:MAG TPA: N-acetylmuramoyl-L-alanine amidase [Chloroflexota bacterium]